MLPENLACYKEIFQYVYSHVFPKVYTASEKRGFDLKSNFHIMFKSYRGKMMIRQQYLANNLVNYENEHKETCEFQQKPIKNFDEFSDSEEQEIKQSAEKRKAARREKAEQLRAKKIKNKRRKQKGQRRSTVE